MSHGSTEKGVTPERWHTVELKFTLRRNLSFGAAGVLLANVLLLAQLGVHAVALKVSLFSSVIVLPLWVATGSLFEAYLFLGATAWAAIRDNVSANVVAIVATVAAIGLLVAVAALVWYLSWAASLCFVAMFFAAVALYVYHDSKLEQSIAAQKPN